MTTLKTPKPVKYAALASGATAGLMALAVSLTGCAPTNPVDEHGNSTLVCTVDDKDRTSVVDDNGHAKSVYRVYTSCGVFNVEDAPFLGRWASADVYASLEPEHTYQLTTYGYRNGYFSMFPNIVEAVEVEIGAEA